MGEPGAGPADRPGVRFSRWLFRLAGVYGLLVLLPMYFMEAAIGRDDPPPITHAEYFYGFVGVAAAWQVVFLVIGGDPLRYRPLMLAAVLEKYPFVVAAAWLHLAGRLPPPILAGAAGDLLLGTLFLVAYWRTARAATSFPGERGT